MNFIELNMTTQMKWVNSLKDRNDQSSIKNKGCMAQLVEPVNPDFSVVS